MNPVPTSQEAHDLCFNNKNALKQSRECGCFYCKTIFNTSAVKQFYKEDEGATGVCPFCGIDALIPDALADLSPEYLNAMHDVWMTVREFKPQFALT